MEGGNNAVASAWIGRSRLADVADRAGPLRARSHRANIAEFLEDSDAKRLFMYLDAKGELTASTHPPGTYKKNQKVRVAAALPHSPLAGGQAR